MAGRKERREMPATAMKKKDRRVLIHDPSANGTAEFTDEKLKEMKTREIALLIASLRESPDVPRPKDKASAIEMFWKAVEAHPEKVKASEPPENASRKAGKAEGADAMPRGRGRWEGSKRGPREGREERQAVPGGRGHESSSAEGVRGPRAGGEEVRGVPPGGWPASRHGRVRRHAVQGQQDREPRQARLLDHLPQAEAGGPACRVEKPSPQPPRAAKLMKPLSVTTPPSQPSSNEINRLQERPSVFTAIFLDRGYYPEDEVAGA